MNDLIGTVCECQHGKIGLVLKENNGIYHGICLEESGNWQSKNPGFKYDCLYDYILDVSDRKRSRWYQTCNQKLE